MRTVQCLILCALNVAPLLLPCTAVAGVQAECAQRLHGEAPAAWKKAAAAFRQFEVDLAYEEVTVYRDQDGRQKRLVDQAAFKLAWDRVSSQYLVEEVSRSGANTGSRRVVNDRYEFGVSKTSGRPFVLEEGREYRSPRNSDLRLTLVGNEEFFVESGLRICHVPLREILASGAFRLRECEYVDQVQRPKRLVRVEWEYVGSEDFKRRYRKLWSITPGAKYWALLDPGNFWLSAQGGFVAPFGAKHILARWTLEMTYQDGVNGLPFPKRVKMRRETDDNTGWDETIVQFGVPHRFARSPAEFRLPYYGIPESAIAFRRPTWLLQLLLIHLGLLGLGVAAWLYWRTKKKKSGAP